MSDEAPERIWHTMPKERGFYEARKVEYVRADLAAPKVKPMSDDILQRISDGKAAREKLFSRIDELETRLRGAAKALEHITATADSKHLPLIRESLLDLHYELLPTPKMDDQ